MVCILLPAVAGLILSIPQVLPSESLFRPSTDLILPMDSFTHTVILPKVLTLLP